MSFGMALFYGVGARRAVVIHYKYICQYSCRHHFVRRWDQRVNPQRGRSMFIYRKIPLSKCAFKGGCNRALSGACVCTPKHSCAATVSGWPIIGGGGCCLFLLLHRAAGSSGDLVVKIYLRWFGALIWF